MLRTKYCKDGVRFRTDEVRKLRDMFLATGCCAEMQEN